MMRYEAYHLLGQSRIPCGCVESREDLGQLLDALLDGRNGPTVSTFIRWCRQTHPGTADHALSVLLYEQMCGKHKITDILREGWIREMIIKEDKGAQTEFCMTDSMSDGFIWIVGKDENEN